MINENGRIHACPVETSLEMISGKWKPRILLHLYRKDVMRYGELKRALQGITPKVLTEQLRELAQDRLVNRKDYEQVPPKVEYSLTPFGQTLAPVLDTIAIWGIEHQQQIIEILQQDFPSSEVVFVGDCEWYAEIDGANQDSQLPHRNNDDVYDDSDYHDTELEESPTVKAVTVHL